MDVIATLQTNAVFQIIQPTKQAFVNLLENSRSEIEKTPHRTFRFGDTDRHQLDVYYPDPKTLPAAGQSMPVLFYIYGGGFVSGDRKQAPPFDLSYSNLGAFFAQRGILTVIPDYRLSPHVQFPEPVKDVRDALAWFLANAATVLASSDGLLSPDTKIDDKVFVVSHSAGANIAATLFLSPALLPLDSPVRAATRGLAYMSGLFQYDLDRDGGAQIVRRYYDSDEIAYANMPVTLLRNAPEELVRALPPVFALKAEREQDEFREGSDAFVGELETRLGKHVKYEVMKGHNHVSPFFALMTGEGEDWAENVAEWIRAN